MSEARVLGDWGTTRLRLFRIEDGPQGAVVTGRLNGPGALEGEARRVLAERLAVWQAEGAIADVVLCGMAGAPGALAPAGYVACPANAQGWRDERTRLVVGGLPVAVLPGLSCRDGAGVPEVMRGEEAQVFGAMALDPALAAGRQRMVLPGTHSKWIGTQDGAVRAFRTHPTGELFALLAGQSTLTGPDTPGEGSFEEGFTRGLRRATEPVGAALFEARAARMLDGRSKDWARGYLSGLLIGAEVNTGLAGDATGDLVLIGDPALCALYEMAFAAVGALVRRVDGDAAVLAGLALAKGTGE